MQKSKSRSRSRSKSRPKFKLPKDSNRKTAKIQTSEISNYCQNAEMQSRQNSKVTKCQNSEPSKCHSGKMPKFRTEKPQLNFKSLLQKLFSKNLFPPYFSPFRLIFVSETDFFLKVMPSFSRSVFQRSRRIRLPQRRQTVLRKSKIRLAYPFLYSRREQRLPGFRQYLR